jgi:ribosome maturation factor RimP
MSGTGMRIQTLERPIQEVVNGLGFELWGIEFLSQGRRSVLRVYIEHENGITVDDCAKVSHQVSALLDVENVIRGEYTLEISSPGLDRLLFRPDQYLHYCGDVLQLSLKAPIQGASKFKGELLRVDTDHIVLKTENGELSIGFDHIQKARLVPQF